MLIAVFSLRVFLCLGDTHSQSEGLFKATLPEGWRWSEQDGRIRISNPKNSNAIAIRLGRVPSFPAEETKDRLTEANHNFIEEYVKPGQGTDIKEEERLLGKIYARQVTWKVVINEQAAQANYITCFHRGYGVAITFTAPDQKQIEEMRQIIESIKFATEPNGPANGNQPIASETNRTSSAAGSRR
jgi:hypothetical protein